MGRRVKRLEEKRMKKPYCPNKLTRADKLAQIMREKMGAKIDEISEKVDKMSGTASYNVATEEDICEALDEIFHKKDV